MATKQNDAVKRGRKPKAISFNFGNRAFTVVDVFNRYKNGKNKLSKVAINVRLTQMVKGNKAQVVGTKTSAGRGRPFKLYRLVRA